MKTVGALAGLLFVAATASAQFVRLASPFPVFDSSGTEFDQPFFGGFNRPIPQLVDIDNDGDLDLFVQEEQDLVRHFENIGDTFEPNFHWRTDQFADIVADGWFYFADLDQDSDFDLLIGNDFDRISYLENTGTATVADFSLVASTLRDPNGTVILTDPPMVPSVLDVDCDGNLDLFLGRQAGTIEHYRLTGFAGVVPQFELVTDRFQDIEVAPSARPASKNESSADQKHGANGQAFFDADSDGDIDLYYGDFFEESLLYFENSGSCAEPAMTRVSDSLLLGNSEFFRTSGFNIPTPADLDGDSDADLVVGVLSESPFDVADNLYFLRNTGGSFDAVTDRLVDGFDAGSFTIPAVSDVNRDGRADLLVGTSIQPNFLGSLIYFENIGEETQPEFRIESSGFIEIAFGQNYAPTFVDIDDDGDDDLFVGLFDGKIAFFERLAGASPNFGLVTDSYMSFDVGSNAVPTFGDMDDDGDFDLIVGDGDGSINYSENVGTADVADFQTLEERVSEIDVGQQSRPYLVDWDEDNDLDLLLGAQANGMWWTENVGSTDSVVFAIPELLELDTPAFASAALVDIDDDGDDDLFLGDVSGGLRFFRNTLVDVGVESRRLGTQTLIETVYPNPVSTGTFHVKIAAPRNRSERVTVAVFDMLGRRIVQQSYDLVDDTIIIELPSEVASGPLLVRVQQGRLSDSQIIVLH